MSAAYRCDITQQCLDDTETKNPSWTILENNNVTVLGVEGIRVSVEVKVDVFQNGEPCHISQIAKQEINRMIKNYVNGL